MRAAFGLLGILVTVGVIIWVLIALMPATQKAAKNVQQKEDFVKQVAGQDVNGLPAGTTIKLAAETRGGKMTGALVTQLTPNGAMERHFGLKKEDTIVQIGPQPMTDIQSAEAAKDFLVEAYQTNRDIVVIRDEKRITLPAANAGAGAGGTNEGDGKSSLQKQLDAVQPTH
ncbi:MAG TPA: hypothetical protein VF669_23235 [Tepidisphaeraceae bacterium]|jgi:hypothetical protein